MSESHRPTWPPSWLRAGRSRCRPGADSVQPQRGKPRMSGRRRFGALRKLPSGRYQASWTGPDGRRRSTATTFATKTEAARWLAEVPFGDYARRWLRDHPRLGPRWRETCGRNLRLHLQPLADLPLRQLTPVVVREWHAAALRGGGGRTSIAQSYRFLRAVLNTAVADGAIARNPCQIRGAGSDRAPERPVATPAQIEALADAITPRYRAAVLLGAWDGLRRGEILGLLRDASTS